MIVAIIGLIVLLFGVIFAYVGFEDAHLFVILLGVWFVLSGIIINLADPIPLAIPVITYLTNLPTYLTNIPWFGAI